MRRRWTVRAQLKGLRPLERNISLYTATNDTYIYNITSNMYSGKAAMMAKKK
jgi:hypothetical protein